DGPKMIPWGPKIETGNCPTPQLYNMKKDAVEQNNLAEQHPEKVFEFQTLLRKIRNQTDKTEF
ncbi:MAG: arylsulfatase, partial [Bacteroidaceae bacterium]|nr:arylsulfatase [Bacteroidaceae bacterium]